ncbi:tetratricopeptide TPR_2 repeat protein [Ketogulonicigenium vulgare Y25]|uniref:Outer membrane protein assembly factor BamD n=2 Tax=Ketogulonicigenium vulgare TaxID=92945 RepID=F9Y9A1_KETVW|nr:outer membrane protein assembly factor BamD [Ketogulonicigenium vulgare]ADO41555.1 tetratricopeptide TPR_2 repeat protein [Ketogulonicigenium vulgare Y25]AEM41318.1 Competence lipoprotein ComL, putative [Ketogulonicigenium vulgare WSH-001]ALJ81455.1 competence protein ComL [Ketogulonicigenium vulgare]ANW34170.1 competence protein ComL [Ketogulonicigenium vulgare]AOZ55054.1 tetratricopeptide TPR_2 repeat protein [Ketogulonicigenium vulgare]
MTMAGLIKATGGRGMFLVAALSATLLAACSSNESSVLRQPGALDAYSAEQVFDLGEQQLNENRLDDAAFFFGEIERLYPYSSWARRGLIMQAFAYHRARDYENSRSAAQRYVDFYPTDEDAAYAQYLLALSYYDQIDDIGRDQGVTFRALQELRRVIELYPDSEYATAAVQKFDLAFDHLAGKEMEVGRYYLSRGNFTAAISRFRVVVEDFQTTTYTPEALMRLVEAYMALGLTDEARSAAAILGHNYQSTPFYADAYALLTGRGLSPEASGDNWLVAIYRQVVRGEWM